MRHRRGNSSVSWLSTTQHGCARRNFRGVPPNGDLRASGPQPPKAAIHVRSQRYRRCAVLIFQCCPASGRVSRPSLAILVYGQWRNCIDKSSVLFYRVWLGNDSVDAACPYRYAVAPISYFRPIRCHSKTSPQYKRLLASLSAAIMPPRAVGRGRGAGILTWAQLGSIRNNTITTLVFFFSHGFGFVTGAENAAPAISLPEIMSRATKRNRPV